MNGRRFRLLWPVLLLALVLPSLAQAQIEANLSSYLGDNVKGYLNPVKQGFGAALQSGMFRSAAIPSTGLQVNVEIKASIVSFGTADRVFTAKTPDGFSPAGTVSAPTVIGDTTSTSVTGAGNTLARFPGGLDIKRMGLAVPQVTIGGIFGTQVMGRYIAFNTGNSELGKVSLVGFGARHSISQYFPGLPLKVAGGFFWQKFKLGDHLIDTSALSIGAMASRSFSILEPYVSLTYDRFAMSVDYTYGSGNNTEKLNVDFGAESKMHPAIGASLNLGFIHLQGEIGKSTQTSYSAGLSLGN